MIRGYRTEGARLHPAPVSSDSLPTLAWVDLEAPDLAEEKLSEQALGLEIPTREDMQEIEPSSRIYHENGVLYLTAQILASPEPGRLDIGPVTFMVQKQRLVTLHYHRPGSFSFFADWAARHDTPCAAGIQTFLGLMEAVVDRLADLLENEQRKLDQQSQSIFAAERPHHGQDPMSILLNRIGMAEERNAKLAESLGTIRRILGFLSVPPSGAVREALAGHDRDQLKSLIHDVRSLTEVAAVQAEKIRFQLDATLGVINIRQSDIIKIFSVVAFVFLPPTLIASIYGMNFAHMPELALRWGYPAALILMVVSAVLPYLFFRWKKWL